LSKVIIATPDSAAVRMKLAGLHGLAKMILSGEGAEGRERTCLISAVEAQSKEVPMRDSRCNTSTEGLHLTA
jgi:hypothetical protein